jgi:hypothetical protein
MPISGFLIMLFCLRAQLNVWTGAQVPVAPDAPTSTL